MKTHRSPQAELARSIFVHGENVRFAKHMRATHPGSLDFYLRQLNDEHKAKRRKATAIKQAKKRVARGDERMARILKRLGIR